MIHYGSLLSNGGNNTGVFNIITDFEVPYSATNQYRPTIDYNPVQNIDY
jgi:hypothetical protein